MLNFREIEIGDKERVEQYLNKLDTYLCSYCFSDIMMWKCAYSTKMCEENGVLYLRQFNKPENKYYYYPPIGENGIQLGIPNILKDARDNGWDFHMAAIDDGLKETLELRYPGTFVFQDRRDSSEYIYRSEDLIQLAGKKYHSKRNFINRFTGTHEGNWEYKDMEKEDLKKVFQFHLDWCGDDCLDEDDGYLGETCAISTALKYFDELGLLGGILYLNGQMIAFTIGSKGRNQSFVIQVEKADAKIPGAYQMINSEFAKRNLSQYEYINREEDLGIEGLRKAKLSYYPTMLIPNYLAVINE